jgi:hypothetical protein
MGIMAMYPGKYGYITGGICSISTALLYGFFLPAAGEIGSDVVSLPSSPRS